MRLRTMAYVFPVLSLLAACGDRDSATPPKDPAVTVAAVVETKAVQDAGDAADDPAIWVDAADPANSVVIGTNKDRGLGVYALDGAELSFRPDGRMNNVDIRQNVSLGGQTVDVVVASNRTDQTIAVYKFDAATRTLAPLMPAVPSGFPEPYGICLYHSAATGDLYVFLSDTNSTVGQWRLFAADTGELKAEQVRTFTVGKAGSQAEGCAADDAQGVLFVAEEDVGFYAYWGEPNLPEDRRNARFIIDTVATGHLTADAEGVTVVDEGNGAGYVIVSSQGSNSYNVYDRAAPYAFRGAFVIGDGRNAAGDPVDGVENTDGIDVTAANLGPAFPGGVFIAQDGRNVEGAAKTKANQNFKLVPWPTIRDALKLPTPEQPATPQ
jgi:3-phytase